jgi:exodeoxyribonuclease V alpha subunit
VARAILGEHATMLQRTLIYTAITRASRLLVIVGSRSALQPAFARREPPDLDSSTLN